MGYFVPRATRGVCIARESRFHGRARARAFRRRRRGGRAPLMRLLGAPGQGGPGRYTRVARASARGPTVHGERRSKSRAYSWARANAHTRIYHSPLVRVSCSCILYLGWGRRKGGVEKENESRGRSRGQYDVAAFSHELGGSRRIVN